MNSIVLKEKNKMNYSIREAFKTLRTNFLFSGPDVKTVVITSCVKNEGKSTISIELAKSLADSEKKVLFIDADLRKSVFAAKYTENETQILGLSEYLSGQMEKEDDVFYSTQYPNLTFVFAGAVPPNPVELVGSSKFENFIKEMREIYDYIIIDSPPLGAVIDSAVISKMCDGAIIVITANDISYRFAAEVKNQIEKSGCKVLGTVLNHVPTKSGSYYSRYYRKYYGKYKKYGKYGKRYGYGYGNYGYGYGYGYGYEPDQDKKGKTKKDTKAE